MKINQKTDHSLKFLIGLSWKRFARVGVSEDKVISFTDCESDAQITVPGVSIAEGILYVSDPEEISQLSTKSFCLGPSSPAQIEMEERDSCNSRRWCAEQETETACEEACHSVTGQKDWQLYNSLLRYLQENLVIGDQQTILSFRRLDLDTTPAPPASPPVTMVFVMLWRGWMILSVHRTVQRKVIK